LWVVRKGATPNYPGTKSFVGGSMGDYSYILEGVDSIASKNALYSTIHGAGRIMGRREAIGKTCRKTGKLLEPGKVSLKDMQDWIKRFGVELRGGGVDESPHVYKKISQVLHHHRETIKVVNTLKPIGVCMAAPHEVDPYKD